MADTPAPVADSPEDTSPSDAQHPQERPKKARGSRSTEDRARARYGAAHGLTGQALTDRWAVIPDGLREAFRHQVR